MNNEKDYTVSEVQTAEMPDIKALKKSHSLFTHGLINIIMPFLIWYVAIAVALLTLPLVETVNADVLEIVLWGLLCIPLISSAIGIIRGVKHFKSGKSAKACFWLSLVAIIVHVLFLRIAYLLGSNF